MQGFSVPTGGVSDSTRMQFVALTRGTRSVDTDLPVIGPPMMSCFARSVYPPMKLTTSAIVVPILASTFIGAAIPSPVTVVTLDMSGSPLQIQS
jgi:hypothetical protein